MKKKRPPRAVLGTSPYANGVADGVRAATEVLRPDGVNQRECNAILRKVKAYRKVSE